MSITEFTVYLEEVYFHYSKVCFIKISSHTEISATKAALLGERKELIPKQ